MTRWQPVYHPDNNSRRLLFRGMMQTMLKGASAPMLNCYGAQALEDGVDSAIRLRDLLRDQHHMVVTSYATNTTSVVSVNGDTTKLGAVCTLPNILKNPDREPPRNVRANWKGHCGASSSSSDGKFTTSAARFDGRCARAADTDRAHVSSRVPPTERPPRAM
jgi:hypothetical protein